MSVAELEAEVGRSRKGGNAGFELIGMATRSEGELAIAWVQSKRKLVALMPRGDADQDMVHAAIRDGINLKSMLDAE